MTDYESLSLEHTFLAETEKVIIMSRFLSLSIHYTITDFNLRIRN